MWFKCVSGNDIFYLYWSTNFLAEKTSDVNTTGNPTSSPAIDFIRSAPINPNAPKWEIAPPEECIGFPQLWLIKVCSKDSSNINSTSL